jgi:hypothetical protein
MQNSLTRITKEHQILDTVLIKPGVQFPESKQAMKGFMVFHPPFLLFVRWVCSETQGELSETPGYNNFSPNNCTLNWTPE